MSANELIRLGNINSNGRPNRSATTGRDYMKVMSVSHHLLR
ncbi:hypothetical protein MtrunA17_Chr8g0374341 [Medicago truncatula]|nr:hypothetical protein MtrunA17_Chr8g0374341 [Medicago truncatula]